MATGQTKKTKKQTKTSSTAKSQNGQTSINICEILKACHETGVKHIKFKELEVSFSGEIAKFEIESDDPIKYIDNSLDVEKKVDDNGNDIESIDESEIEELKITNPAAYEDIMERTHA